LQRGLAILSQPGGSRERAAPFLGWRGHRAGDQRGEPDRGRSRAIFGGRARLGRHHLGPAGRGKGRPERPDRVASGRSRRTTMTAPPLRSKPLPWALLLASVVLPPACASRQESAPALASPPVAVAVVERDVGQAPATSPTDGDGTTGRAAAPPPVRATAAPPRVSRVEPVTLPTDTPLTFDRAFGVAETRNANLVQQRSALERSRVNY